MDPIDLNAARAHLQSCRDCLQKEVHRNKPSPPTQHQYTDLQTDDGKADLFAYANTNGSGLASAGVGLAGVDNQYERVRIVSAEGTIGYSDKDGYGVSAEGGFFNYNYDDNEHKANIDILHTGAKVGFGGSDFAGAKVDAGFIDAQYSGPNGNIGVEVLNGQAGIFVEKTEQGYAGMAGFDATLFEAEGQLGGQFDKNVVDTHISGGFKIGNGLSVNMEFDEDQRITDVSLPKIKFDPNVHFGDPDNDGLNSIGLGVSFDIPAVGAANTGFESELPHHALNSTIDAAGNIAQGIAEAPSTISQGANEILDTTTQGIVDFENAVGRGWNPFTGRIFNPF